MSVYAMRRAMRLKLDSPIDKLILCFLAYCPNFSYLELAEDCALSFDELELAIITLCEKNLIKFRNGYVKSTKGIVYQVEILF